MTRRRRFCAWNHRNWPEVAKARGVNMWKSIQWALLIILALVVVGGLLYYLPSFPQLLRISILTLLVAALIGGLGFGLIRALLKAPADTMGPWAWVFLVLAILVIAGMTYAFTNLGAHIPQGHDNLITRNFLPEIIGIPAPREDAVKWDGTKLTLTLSPDYQSEVMVDGKKTGPYNKGNSTIDIPLPAGVTKPSRVKFYRHDGVRAGPYREWVNF